MLTFFQQIFHRILKFGPIDFVVYNLGRLINSEEFKTLTEFLNKWAIIFHGILSLAICFVMEWLSRHSFAEAQLFTQDHTKAYLYNSFVIFIIFSLVFLVKRRTVFRLILTAIFIFLGFINCVVLLNRVTPFGFTDFYMIGDLLTMKNTSYFTSSQAMGLVIFGVVFLISMVILAIKGPKKTSHIKFPIRLALVIFGFVSLSFTTSILQQYNVLASYFGNLAQGYRDYGYLYGFNMSIFSRGMDKPLFYSEDSINDLLADTDMGASTIDAENGPNIIVMLLESFYDVSETKFLHTDMEPTPYFNYLKENFSSGYLTVPVVGAGTCNTEFEVLTGMSCEFFGPGEYPQKTILKEVDSCESVADIVKDLGYSTHVVHNNGGNFYSRKNAFSKMGFDSFTSKEMLDITEWTPLGSWPKDDILTEATQNALDSTEGRDFIYTITVETHGDYPERKVLSNPIIDVTATGKTEGQRYAWEYYVNMLKQEDDFLRRYISMLERRNEPTLVIMFGDHLPTMGLNDDDQKNGSLFTTNYATWNNFDMEKQDADLTSYQLVSEYLNRLGIHGGALVNYNQRMTATNIHPKSVFYLNGIHSLQYDILYGKRYVYKNKKPYPATDIEMGTQDVVINKIYAYNDRLHIFGENFTQWSRVFVDDEPVNTTYQSGQLLTIDLENLEEVDPIRVCQMGSGNSIFRESNKVWYYR